VNLSTQFLGMTLKNPIVPSASPLTATVDGICQMEEAGAAAVVMHSLFEEQIDLEALSLDHFLSHSEHSHAEALSYFPDMHSYVIGPELYLESIRKAKARVGIPVIASLNGVSVGGWTKYARLMAEAGADALELNVYYVATNLDIPSAAVEEMYLDVLREVKRSVSVPVVMKLSPYFSSMAHMAKQLATAGADALVLFNRFYQPDLDLEHLVVTPRVVLSTSDEIRLPLRWTAILSGRVDADLAISSGVHTHEDVLKAMMAGAKVAMMTSELLHNGVRRIPEILQGMVQWMEEHEYESVAQMQGSMSQRHVAEPAAFERANYMKVLKSYIG